MFERKSNFFLCYMVINILLLCLMFIHASLTTQAEMPLLRSKGEMVRDLELTDLCLFTEARYTRHPAMADLSTPFQDHPMSFEHFPSGSILLAPPHLSPSPRPSPPRGEGKGKGD